ncbi:hypothetical protein OIO90_000872 [Microbotryomycetes sp. JL221]|nr:hypothetical protein OIO90_000872 [Microbotryomycetes sp. JL221]
MDVPEPQGSNAVFESVKHYNRRYQILLGTWNKVTPDRSRSSAYAPAARDADDDASRVEPCSASDRTTPHTFQRWGATTGFFLLFWIRILWIQAFYIVVYALGIYLLNLFLAFLQPKFDPSLQAADVGEADVADDAPGLPTSASQAARDSSYDQMQDGEFRPFIRRLPEFKFWYAATKAIVISLTATLFPVFDVPVFWPILLVYFCVLFTITMRRQIAHMRKYKYVPFDIGRKQTYANGSGGSNGNSGPGLGMSNIGGGSR